MSNMPNKVFLQEINKDKNKKAIISTAFQDHIIKQLQLNSLNLNLTNNLNINKKLPKIEAKSKVNSGLNKTKDQTKKNLIDIQNEYVIKEPNTTNVKTLAEKIGLVPTSSSSQLDENDWLKVKDKYIRREDYKEPCVICKEVLGTQSQVLLSCSHTFHRKCLEAFEKFSGKKSCPMCRKEKYQTRVIYDASKHYKHLSASKIQAAWRGYLVRKWYKTYRKSVPPNNPILRKKYFQEKLTNITNRIVQSFNHDETRAENLIQSIDENILKSREAFKKFDEQFKIITEDQWSELMKKALLRKNEECSICINNLSIPENLLTKMKQTESITTTTNLKTLFKSESHHSHHGCFLTDINNSIINTNKPIVLLSCSHIFHDICLKTFEELNFDRSHSCPECRSTEYQKYNLTF